MSANFTLEQLRWAVQSAGLGVWDWDIQQDVVTWSLEMGQIFGVSEDRFPTSVAEYAVLLHPLDRASVQARIGETIAAHHRAFLIEHRVLLDDGRVRWVGGSGQLDLDAAGVPIRLRGTAMDITAQKNLEQTAEQFRLFSELASDYVYVVQVVNGQPLSPSIVAGSFERATGYTTAQVAQKGGWPAIIHPDDLVTLGPVFEGVAAGKPMVAEYRIVGPDNETRWLRDHIRPVLENGILVRMMGGVQDITEQKLLEEKLSHALRMEALARLAGTVAHDFNNILLVISASVDLMEPTSNDDANNQPLREDILAACQRASELTRSLLTFGRKVAERKTPVLLGEVVDKSHTMLARAVGDRTKLTVELHPDVPAVEVDVAQLQMALLNLAVNAHHAMPNGGNLLIRVRDGCANDGQVNEIASKRFVALEVTDTGTGIAPEILPRIFEPFFTTKGPAEGVGLGLATCHSIVSQAGGTIRVRSRLGHGTTFTIYLPATDRAVAVQASHRFRGTVGGTERVLLLEDEPLVRRLVKRILEDHGYVVAAAGDVAEARALFASQSFSLLLSDVRLPDGDGAAFAQDCKGMKPDLRVVLITGFAEDEAMQIIARHGFPVLYKPFASDVLARTVREAIDVGKQLG